MVASPEPQADLSGRHPLAETLLGFLVLWLVLDHTATGLGSLRGEGGLLVCTATLLAALVVEFALTRGRPLQALANLGLRRPAARPLLWSLALAAVLFGFFPIYAVISGTRLTLQPGWPLLAIGIFAQGGIAEEVVFRGFLFRRLRAGRSFWRAAGLAAVPFVAVHLLLFATLSFWVALGAFAVAVSLSFPLAWLFDRSGGSIWPPAIVHAVVQGAIKLVDAGDGLSAIVPVWLVLGAALPWSLMLLIGPGAATDGQRQ